MLGKAEPSILTFTDQHGREIGDYPQDEPVVDDDGSDVEYDYRVRVRVRGVVHAWVGQKLLNCFIFKCFTRKTLKKKSIGHR